ncbi:MAG: hypothetical protein FWF88_00670 [Peptococcaceae bacterium]|nr:hypothetical protein [Peptococcaceae bacterium]
MVSYDRPFLDEIKADFMTCAGYVDNMVLALDKVAGEVSVNYSGQAKPITEEVYWKIKEHFLLLNECFTSAADFVEFAMENMERADNIAHTQLNRL